MIDCPDYLGGDWKQKLQFIFPPHMYKKNGGYYTEKDSCSIDVCIAEEILYLWKKGICTCGCCCGHGVGYGYIDVINEHIPKMLELGYTQIEKSDGSKHSFYAKSKHKGE